MKTYTLDEIEKLVGAKLQGDKTHRIAKVASLDKADHTAVSFLDTTSLLANPRYREMLQKTEAGLICIDHREEAPKGKNVLFCDDPSATFQKIAALLMGDQGKSAFTNIHETAVIHPSAKLGKGVTIGPFVVIDQNAVIGDQSRIDAHCFIGADTTIGSDVHFYPRATVRERCWVGNRVILQPGAVIGSCGFGYLSDAKGHHTKIEQMGTVILEDDVEIGANATIDRARFDETRIKRGSKIDNLVQIGHNVTVGEDNLIAAQTGIAGSTTTGRLVMMGGQVGILGHIELCAGARIATRGGVGKSIKEPGNYGGSPCMPLADYNRNQVQLRNIGKLIKEVAELKKSLSASLHP